MPNAEKYWKIQMASLGERSQIQINNKTIIEFDYRKIGILRPRFVLSAEPETQT